MNLADYIYGTLDESTAATYFIKDQPPPMKSRQIWNVMLQITRGVEFLHCKYMVHRDLKPVNGIGRIPLTLTEIVLYSRKDSVWKVADFGYTTQLRQSRSSVLTTDGRGTEGYYPPEFLEETAELRYSTKLDIWQLGCIVFEFALGRRAFSSNLATLKYKEGLSKLEVRLDNEDSFGEDCKKNISSCIFSMLQIEERQRPTASEMVARFLELHVVGERWTESPEHNRTNIRHSFLPLPLPNRVDTTHQKISTAPTQLQTSLFEPSTVAEEAPAEETSPSHSHGIPLSTESTNDKVGLPELSSPLKHGQPPGSPSFRRHALSTETPSKLPSPSSQTSLPPPLANRIDTSVPYWNISSTPAHLPPPPIPYFSSQTPSSAETSSTTNAVGTLSDISHPALHTTSPQFSEEGIIPAESLESLEKAFGDLDPLSRNSGPSFYDDTNVNAGEPAIARDDPSIPSLQDLAMRGNNPGRTLGRGMPKAVILKALPQCSYESLAHLSHDQLAKYVDDLVESWKAGSPPPSNPSIPLASQQSLLPSTCIGPPQSFSGRLSPSSSIERVYYTINASKIWGKGPADSIFHDLFSALRKHPYSYRLWYDIYLRFPTSAEFQHMLMLADETLFIRIRAF
jgi:serine/threonine protein kinase